MIDVVSTDMPKDMTSVGIKLDNGDTHEVFRYETTEENKFRVMWASPYVDKPIFYMFMRKYFSWKLTQDECKELLVTVPCESDMTDCIFRKINISNCNETTRLLIMKGCLGINVSIPKETPVFDHLFPRNYLEGFDKLFSGDVVPTCPKRAS